MLVFGYWLFFGFCFLVIVSWRVSKRYLLLILQRMSGHSKWATTHRQKEVADQKRGRIFTKLGRAITIAAKQGDGDPDSNFKLRLAMERAKQANMPKDNIERAIKRGTGEAGGATIEEVVYEAFGPEGVALIIKVLADNKNRTLSGIKNILNKSGGKLAGNNAIAWMFAQKGVLKISNYNPPAGGLISNVDEFELKLIEIGADDLEEDGNDLIVYTALASFQKVKEFVESKNLKIDSAEVEFVPKKENLIEVKNPEALEKLLAALEEDDDVEEVYTNAK